MTTQRRSLSTALEVTPEKLAFINGTEGSAQTALPPPDEEQKASKPKRSMASRERRQHEPDAEDAPLIGTPLVPLTTRLQTMTADALKRAYLERKLRGRTPNTQQEIVEEALQAWLRGEGHL